MDPRFPSGQGSRPRMALEAVGGVKPVAFAPRTEEPEEVVAVTTLSNYSQLVVTLCRFGTSGHSLDQAPRHDSTFPAQSYRIQSEIDILVSPLDLGSSGDQTREESSKIVLFEGQQLREIMGRTPNDIELRNEHGRCCRLLSSAEALALDLDLFVGVGNRRRIRFILETAVSR
jgi:hypothetical protein